MSGSFQSPFSPSDLKEEKVETAAAEEFQVKSEYQAGPFHGSTFPLSTSSNSNWNTCLKTEENPDVGDYESIPIYATALLDPSFMEHQGTLNGVKVEEDSDSNFHFPEEEDSKETAETYLKGLSCPDSEQEHIRAHGGSLSSHLQFHKRSLKSEGQFKCEHCTLSFKKYSNLKQHRRIHVRPFKCEVCPAGFQTSSNLERLHVHNDERRFKCELFSSNFKRSDSLKKHRRIHTDECPFK